MVLIPFNQILFEDVEMFFLASSKLFY